MTRSLCLLLLSFAMAVPAVAQVRPPLARVSADEIREAMRRPDVRANISQNLRAASPSDAVIAAHEIDPAHLRNATSDEGPEETGRRAPRALTQRLSPERARAVLADADFELSPAFAQTAVLAVTPNTTVQAVPQRANPSTTTPRRTNPTTAQRVNPRATAGAAGQLAAQPAGPTLDVLGFAAGLHNALNDETNGYVMRLAKDGQPIATLQWNWARRPSDGGVGWNPQRRMHIASVSKLITAIAAVNLLHDKGISYDASIEPYLPAYWSRGSNIGTITFRDLLTHRSGIEVPGSATNYATMKAEIAAGVSGGNSSQYENTNFALFRILIPVINGDVSANAMDGLANFPAFQGAANAWWDIVTVNAYEAYINTHVFSPSGVAGGPGLTHASGDAIAYMNPWNTGWDSGNLRSVAGGAGWVMSADQLLSVMAHFRHTDSIVPRSVAFDAMEARLGLDVKSTTPAGTLYNKNGLWRDGSGRTEQSLAYFLPDGMELVVFTNSPITSDGVFFRTLVTNLYTANLN